MKNFKKQGQFTVFLCSGLVYSQVQFLNEEACTAQKLFFIDPSGTYLFKVNNENTRMLCAICSQFAIKTPEWRRHCSGVFIFNFEQIAHIFLVFPLFTLTRKCQLGRISVFHVNKSEAFSRFLINRTVGFRSNSFTFYVEKCVFTLSPFYNLHKNAH